MSWDMDLVKSLNEKYGKKKPLLCWDCAQCVKVAPLTFSIRNSNFLFDAASGLNLSAVAADYVWQVGDSAAAILAGASLLVLDKINRPVHNWDAAECIQTAPLTFTIKNGARKYDPASGLVLTAVAADYVWKTGDTAAAIQSDSLLLIADKINRPVHNWDRAECIRLDPLTFTIKNGARKFDPTTGLILTATASLVDWKPGYTAASVLSDDTLLIIDRI